MVAKRRSEENPCPWSSPPALLRQDLLFCIMYQARLVIPGEERGDQKHNGSVERTVGVQDRKGERTELRNAKDEEIRHNRTSGPGWLGEGKF